MKPKFTTGPDLIPEFVIKDYAAIFSKPLTFLFNLILDNRKFPDRWKVFKIVPLFKSGNRSGIENYRPVSILNNFAKVFEMILVDDLSYQRKNLIAENQHGFVLDRSTVTNLLTITQCLANNLDKDERRKGPRMKRTKSTKRTKKTKDEKDQGRKERKGTKGRKGRKERN